MTVPKKIITVSVGDSPWADYRKLPTQCRTEACKAEFVLLKCGWLVSPSRGLFYGFSVSFSVIYKNKKDRFKVRALLVHTVSIFGGWLMRSYWRQTLDLVAKAPRDFDIWYNGLQKLLRITKQYRKPPPPHSILCLEFPPFVICLSQPIISHLFLKFFFLI
uniref:PH domain-containing protein n=1 Tax=Lotharella globosa TaxID=91324 RepID=A0A6V3MQU3_9EUKA|mmetsp:Transcript_9385/g.18309  ORF Transcript_9385/g.18309 Transcript_9385/m.18309 type:complete len:161 (+) Transcript_9385:2375-2857(+)